MTYSIYRIAVLSVYSSELSRRILTSYPRRRQKPHQILPPKALWSQFWNNYHCFCTDLRKFYYCRCIYIIGLSWISLLIIVCVNSAIRLLLPQMLNLECPWCFVFTHPVPHATSRILLQPRSLSRLKRKFL